MKHGVLGRRLPAKYGVLGRRLPGKIWCFREGIFLHAQNYQSLSGILPILTFSSLL
jgi:hypothetical protein